MQTATPHRLRRQVVASLDLLEYSTGTLLGRYGGEKF